jgi:three-Cys-motif partner protein
MNRNVLWHQLERVTAEQTARMTAYWGDESWRKIAYTTTRNLFRYPEKEPNQVVAEAFRQRLKDAAGFGRVPEPMPMRNSKGAIVYYLFFASQKDTAENIVLDVFDKYRNRGAT